MKNRIFHTAICASTKLPDFRKGMVIIMNRTNYGNWVPKRMMRILYSISIVLMIVALLETVFLKNVVLTIILWGCFIVSCSFTMYMQLCRNAFDFAKGGLMGKIHQDVVEHLPWDGEGKLLDIGCGAGALSIRCAKAFPKSTVTGMDYWGVEWNYSQKQCEQNATVEGVADRTTFLHGDAAHLPFEDESFDAIVSNFVFHEVQTQPDKQALILEALRVLKKGGCFSLQDMMSQENLYGDMNSFCEKLLKNKTVSQIHFLANTQEQEYIPDYIKTPWMLSKMGMIYGIK